MVVPQADSKAKGAHEALTDIPIYTTLPGSFLSDFDKTATSSVPLTQGLPSVATPSADPTANPDQPSASEVAGSSPDNGDVTVTVTATVPAATVFVTHTVTARTAGTTPSSAPAPLTPSGRSKKLRRGAGEWRLGQQH